VKKSSGLTLRAFGIGIVLVVSVNLAAPYSLHVLHSSLLASDYMPIGALFPFFLVVALLNLVLKLLRPSWALSPSELIVVFIMTLVGSSLPTYGLTGYLIAVISAPFFFASPENQWGKYILPYIPDWLVPKGLAVKWFYDGLPHGERIPWGAWAIPLFWWLSLMAVVMFVAFCIVVILRKQWVEHERLLFPLVELPAEMAEGSDDPSPKPRFMRNRMFWIGFLVPLGLVLWNAIHYFSPFVPQIPIGGWGIDKMYRIQIARDFPSFLVNVYPPIIGFAFLMNLDILFSFWFFHLLILLQVGIFARIGYSIGPAEHYCSEYDASLGWQSMGAFVAMVLWSLWTARRHIRNVFRKALGNAPDMDDSEEMLSYRKAVIGLILGTAFIVAWLRSAGMDWKVLAVFLPTVFIIYLGTTRIVTEGGLAFARGPMVAQTFTSYIVGSEAISPHGMAALAISYAGFCEIKNSFMPAFAHSAKLSGLVWGPKRRVALTVLVAVVVALATSIPWTIYLGYKHGAFNFSTWIFTPGGRLPYDYMVNKMRNPFSTDFKRLTFFGIGGGLMMLLTFLRARFPWWPLHPIGLTLATAWPIKMSAFSLFLGWACKWIVVRMGGIQLYRKAKPLFLGLILGYFTGVAISNIIDFIWFPGQGHWLYGLY